MTLMNTLALRRSLVVLTGVNIAGCRVTDGHINRGSDVRLSRDGKVIHESAITSLRHFRDEVTEITAGMDCGVVVQGFNDIEEGDILEVHRQERERR